MNRQTGWAIRIKNAQYIYEKVFNLDSNEKDKK